MTLLDFLLGDRAGSYFLISCLLVTTLAIIAAIIDIPVRSLREAGLTTIRVSRHSLPRRILWAVGLVALWLAWLGAAIQAYSAGVLIGDPPLAIAVLIATNAGLVCAIAVWGLSGPLTRHWGLCMGSYGFGFASFFLLLAGILQLDFRPADALPGGWQRLLFAAMIGLILLSIAICLASIVALVAHVFRGATVLVREHRAHHENVSFAISAKLAHPGGSRTDGSTGITAPASRVATGNLEALRRSAGIEEEGRTEQRA